MKTQKQFWIFNTHFDHIGKKEREKSAELIISKINELNTQKLPVVLMGDLNLIPEETPIQFIMEALTDGQISSKQDFYGPETFSSFDHNRGLKDCIDHIFIQDFTVESYIHIDNRMENNKHISDHLPVLTKIHIEN